MKIRRILLSALTAAIFLVAVLWISGVQVSDIIQCVANSRGDYLGYGFLFYIGVYTFRALRFRVLLRARAPSLVDVYAIGAVHNIFNQIMPARTGELSYVFLLKNRFQVPSATGIASLLVARVLDLIALILYFGMGVLLFMTRIDFSPVKLGAVCLAVLFIALLVLFNLPRLAQWAFVLSRSWATALKWQDRKPVRIILEKGREVAEAFQEIRSPGTLLQAFLYSLLTWLGIFLCYYWVLLSFQVVDPEELTFGISIVGSSGLNFACILPINGLGSLGSWEAGWVAGYLFTGKMEMETAATTGFGLHIVVLGYVLILGFLGWIRLWSRGK